ncbi:hypothetical protein [Streptomyces sp. S186]|uniref:hypothetical protein n=1 Tax=Streptomyces sp. S186 TaxID=3434395 RepID=UPI003F669EB4
MASHDSDFKPAKVNAPKTSTEPPSGSGAAQEASHEIIESRPQFTNLSLEQVKALVANSNPEEVGRVAESWKKVRIALVGEDWNSGIKKHFDDAVTKVLQSWHGSSADQFAKQAQKISDNFANLAPYPHNTGHVLQQISERLAWVKASVDGVQEPTGLERAADRLHDFSSSGTGKIATFVPGGAGVAAVSDMLGITGDGRDDSGLNKDLANPNMSIWDAMNKNRDNLSIDRERQLQAAHYMEQLGTTYRAGAKLLGNGRGQIDDGDRIRPPGDGSDGGGGTMPPFVPFGPTPSGPNGGAPAAKIPGMKGSGYQTPPAMDAPRPKGIDGGIGSLPKTPATPIKTGLEGLQGTTGLGAGGAHGIGGGPGGGLGTSGLGTGVGGGSGPGIGGSGVPGMPGGVGVGGGAGGRAGGVGGRAGGTGAGAGAGARAGGRAGMPGMAGAAGAKGGGAKGAGAAGKGGPLARQKGGVVGGKGGKAGAGAQGGSGLHRSRGGKLQGGAAGGRRPAGMAGAPGAHGAKGKDKGNANGQRPDYLVEEEETWTPERNVAPKVIE